MSGLGDASVTLDDIVTDNARRLPDVVASSAITRSPHAALREHAINLTAALTYATNCQVCTRCAARRRHQRQPWSSRSRCRSMDIAKRFEIKSGR